MNTALGDDGVVFLSFLRLTEGSNNEIRLEVKGQHRIHHD